MKNPILVYLSIVLLPCFAHCQSDISSPDTAIYGDIQHNYPGGQDAYNEYLTKSGPYPEPAKSALVQGTVYIRFMIEKDSTLSHIHLCDGAGSGMDEASMRLIANSGKWVPSRINGVSVRTHCIVAIRFSLDAGERPISKNGVYGTVEDTSHLNKIFRIESLGIPVTEATDYVNKNIHFMGRVTGTKRLSDTVFIATCGNVNQLSSEVYINVIFIGTKSSIKNLVKTDLVNCLITGTGFVLSREGIAAIIISDDTQYRIIKPSPKSFRGIYDFENR